ncbi:MarR family winged helix-turn-helix transcriptional regulator [Dactylosporangium sp. NPDC000555]|uniref:MarR family winged helix-turn-helix transcriptional regulator n=1 Tax=Dactylosporangium sp. NPDC000555 TaxID=3154260 RepID=UPI00332C7F70
MRVDRSYVVEAINELAERGLVVRAVDPANRRRNTITITEAVRRTADSDSTEVLPA